MRRLWAAGAAMLVCLAFGGMPALAQSDSPKPEVGCEPSADDRWTVADLSAFEAAVESGDYDQFRALFTDDGIITTAGNIIALYYGETAELGAMGGGLAGVQGYGQPAPW